MKKLFILSALAFGLFTACSNNTDKDAEAVSETEQEQMNMSTDSTMAYADSANVAAEKAAKDSADSAHGHSH